MLILNFQHRLYQVMGSKKTMQTKLLKVLILFSVLHFAFGAHSEQTSDKQLKNDNADSVVALTMENLSGNIDSRISGMKILANTIANDTHIQQWVDNGFAQEEEVTLVNKLSYLVSEYGLTSASFANTKSNRYWNHEGFLRILAPEIDTWYFAYLKSGEQDLISVYHDKNKKRVDLYVNYRQPNGNGLSGIATSFNGVVKMLASSPLNKDGELFIVDSEGKIQVHPDPNVTGKFTLQQLYSAEVARTLLTPKTVNYASLQASKRVDSATVKEGYLVSSYIPSMNWFIVAHLKGELY